MKARPERDVWVLAETPAPSEPTPGMRLWVNTGATWRDGYAARVADVSAERVTVRREGRLERFPRDEWPRWLLERSREGPVQVDGHSMTPPSPAPLGPWGPPDRDERSSAMDLDARDARIFRAVRDVLKGYRIGPPVLETGLVVHEVTKPGQPPYHVKLDPAWRLGPQCSCPDWKRVAEGVRGGYCKHVVAVLLQSDDHRHQLLDLLL